VWTLTVTVQNVIFHYQRDYNMYPHISWKMLSSFRTLLHKAMITTEGSYERKQRGYLNQWSHFRNLMILTVGFRNGPFACNFETQTSCIKLSITLMR
jgi:hypothetical protein